MVIFFHPYLVPGAFTTMPILYYEMNTVYYIVNQN